MFRSIRFKIGLGLLPVGLLFAAAGGGMGGYMLWQHETWPKVDAEVVALVRCGGNRAVTCPVFRYTPLGGRGPVEVTASGGSNPPAFRVGEHVPLAVDPADPERIAVRSEALLLIGIFGGIGGLIALGGAGLLFVSIRAWRRAKLAQETGEESWAAIRRVRHKTEWKVNGRSPWVIELDWTAPDGTQHAFHTEDLWVDPSPSLPADGRLPVRVVLSDPANLHWVDLSPLGRGPGEGRRRGR